MELTSFRLLAYRGSRRAARFASAAALALLSAAAAAAQTPAQTPGQPPPQTPASEAVPPTPVLPQRPPGPPPAVHLTLDRAIELALQHNHTLLAARTTIDQN